MDFGDNEAPARSDMIYNFIISEELFISKINTLNNVYKDYFISLDNTENLNEDDYFTQADITFIFYNTDIIPHCKRLINILNSYNADDSLYDQLEIYFGNVDVQNSFNNLILSSSRSFVRLSKKMSSSLKLCKILSKLKQTTTNRDSLGSLLGYISQRFHCYIPLLEQIQDMTPIEHVDYSKFGPLKHMIESIIISFPVVSRVGIGKLLQMEHKLNQVHSVKLPSSGFSSNFQKELICEGVMWQISHRGSFEVKEKCYLIVLVRKIICIAFDKIETFKHTYVGPDIIDDTSPDIKWSVNLSDCTFSTKSLDSLDNSWKKGKKIFVITETSLSNMEPYVVQEIRYLIPEINSPKDHSYWENSFSIAQSYSLHLEKKFALTISKQIESLQAFKNENNLTTKQWKTLASAGKLKTYSAGNKILEQGDDFNKIYWLTRGSATITRRTDESVACVGTIEKYNIFGELGYLTSIPTTSNTVYANSDSAVYSVSYSKLNLLLVKHNSLALPFFKLLCSQIVLHLMTGYSLEIPKNKKIASTAELLDEEFLINENSQRTEKEYIEVLKATGYPNTTNIEYGCNCNLKGEKKKQKATVLCLHNTIVIYAKAFGGSTKILLKLTSLNEPEIIEKQLTFSLLTDPKSYTLLFTNNEERDKLYNMVKTLKHELLSSKSDKHNLVSSKQKKEAKTPILSESDWNNLVGLAEIKKYKSGQVIIRQGKKPDYLFQLYSGTCDVFVERKTSKGSSFEVMESFTCGDKFGESGFIIPGLYSTASVVVTSDSLKVLAISRENIAEMITKTPSTESGLYCYVAQQLAHRYIDRQNVVTNLRGSLTVTTGTRKSISESGYISWNSLNKDTNIQPELVASVDNYYLEYGNYNAPQSDFILRIEDIEGDYDIYNAEFTIRTHLNLIGYSYMEEKFVAVSICLKAYIEEIKVMVLVRREQDGYKIFRFVIPKKEQIELNSNTTIPLLKNKIPELSRYHFYHVKDEKIINDFLNYENNEITRQYKFGLLYLTGNAQNETEIYSPNVLSADLLELMMSLGDLIKLADWDKFSGGLDCSGKNITGPLSLYSVLDNFYDIMFHVAPMIPCEPNDEQQIGKKRHLGNDMVILVFTDTDTLFDPSSFKSQFNHIFIVIKKMPVDAGGGSTFYKVEMICKECVPYICRPILSKIIPKNEIKKYLLTKLINAERMVLKTNDFQLKLRRTRRQLLEHYASQYAPHLKNPPKETKSPRRKSGGSTGRRKSAASLAPIHSLIKHTE